MSILYVHQYFRLTMIVMLLLYMQTYYFSNNADAHLLGSKIQVWMSKRDNIRIDFAYKPDRPIIDTFTTLNFSVLKLSNGEHIKDFDARVVVTSGQRLFKFENITVSDGDFSIKYIFPDDGTHQVITRVNTNNSVHIADFSVFVPHQPPPSLLNPLTPVMMLLIGAAVGIIVLILVRRK